MAENELVTALNIDVTREPGVVHAARDNLLLRDLPYSLVAIHRYLDKFLIHAGDFLYYNAFGSSAPSTRSFSDTYPMDAVNYEGNVYLCNGAEFLKYDGSDFSTPFITAPDAGSAAQGADGDLPKGKYYYVLTWKPSANNPLKPLDRDESPPSDSFNVTIKSNKKISLSSLPTQSGYNLVIYRWMLGQGSEYREVTEITDSSTTYTDNLTYWELGLAIKTEEYETPPIPKHISLFRNNLFASGIKSWQSLSGTVLDNYLFYSDDRRLSGWSPYFLFNIGETDDKIMNHAVIGDVLAVYTRTSIKRIEGYSAASYVLKDSNATTGLAAEYALTSISPLLHLMLGSDRKLYFFNGIDLVTNEQLRKVDYLFEKNSTHPYRINWDEREKCRLTYFNKVARLAYPSYGQTENDKVLNMDFSKAGIIKFTISNYSATCFYADKINHVLYMGNTSKQLKEVEGDVNNFLSPVVKTKDFDEADIHELKTYNKINVDYDSKGENISCAFIVDGQTNNTVNINKDGREEKEIIDASPKENEGNRIALQLSWPAGKKDISVYDWEYILSDDRKK
jgi:hypothetical protein